MGTQPRPLGVRTKRGRGEESLALREVEETKAGQVAKADRNQLGGGTWSPGGPWGAQSLGLGGGWPEGAELSVRDEGLLPRRKSGGAGSAQEVRTKRLQSCGGWGRPVSATSTGWEGRTSPLTVHSPLSPGPAPTRCPPTSLPGAADSPPLAQQRTCGRHTCARSPHLPAEARGPPPTAQRWVGPGSRLSPGSWVWARGLVVPSGWGAPSPLPAARPAPSRLSSMKNK